MEGRPPKGNHPTIRCCQCGILAVCVGAHPHEGRPMSQPPAKTEASCAPQSDLPVKSRIAAPRRFASVEVSPSSTWMKPRKASDSNSSHAPCRELFVRSSPVTLSTANHTFSPGLLRGVGEEDRKARAASAGLIIRSCPYRRKTSLPEDHGEGRTQRDHPQRRSQRASHRINRPDT